MADTPPKKSPGGLVHTYRGYDPQRYPMPDHAPADLVSPAFDHLMAYGSLDDLTPEQLAEAVEIDPSQIKGLGPSIQSLLAILEERRRRILETYETSAARRAADAAFRDATRDAQPPAYARTAFEKAIREEQLADLERLWYRLDGRHDFAASLIAMMEALGEKFQVEQLASKYDFSGRREMGVSDAIEIKEELETIDRLIERLREAAR
ncbi:MAG: hypothetical protein KDA33_13400, partial [Phycisphaerales bacterium]|nr:hypothetical protein [Phycisphaerales bacterium]